MANTFVKRQTFRPELPKWQRYALTVLACTGTSLITTPLIGRLDLANIVMLFLLTVLLVAITFGMKPALLAAFLSVGMFDFFFVPPRFTFIVNDGQYLVTFAVMLVVAIITGRLAGGLRRQVNDSAAEERHALALSEMARELSGALTLEQVMEITRSFLHRLANARGDILLYDKSGELLPDTAAGLPMLSIEPRLATIAYAQGKPVECSLLAGSGYAALYLPLKAPMRMRGVIAVGPEENLPDALHAQRARLETMASLVAIAVERIHYVDVAQRTQVQVVSERLRSSILSALSHDLRTPLTALVGLADSLAVSKPPLNETARETAEALREQAERLSGLVGNLLDMARLHAGDVTLHKEWQPIEEVIGSSIKLLGRALAEHPVKVTQADDLPLVEFDAVLIERVFCNLLENSAKYSPSGSAIEIGVTTRSDRMEISVSDHGPGFLRAGDATLFDMFVRGEIESAKPGVGLGLAICRAIVEAHGGSISASDRAPGGACITFSLPLGEPPLIEEEILPAGEGDAS